MIPIFCTLERAFDHHPIEVNVNQIWYMEGDRDSTTIYFSHDRCIVVSGPVDQVRLRIETSAMVAMPLAKVVG